MNSTYHGAWWAGSPATPPAWPQPRHDGTVFDRAALAREFAPWCELKHAGVKVHCGELGCFHHTPHTVFLAWLEDLLTLLREHDIGWALWNFRGSFGVLDSGRSDVAYEDWHGCRLDGKLLKLLQRC